VRTASNQWTQFEGFPEFMEGVKEVKQLDDRHLDRQPAEGERRLPGRDPQTVEHYPS